MDPSAISHCWVNARSLPAAMEATVMAMQGSYRHSLRTVAEDVEKVLLHIGSCSIGARCFGDAGPAECQLAVEIRGIDCGRESPQCIESDRTSRHHS